jgi:hypothetical protein
MLIGHARAHLRAFTIRQVGPVPGTHRFVQAGQGARSKHERLPVGLGGVVLIVAIDGACTSSSRPAMRARVMDILRGLGEGLRSVFPNQDKGAFILHTFLIWACTSACSRSASTALPGHEHVPARGSWPVSWQAAIGHRPGAGRYRRVSLHSWPHRGHIHARSGRRWASCAPMRWPWAGCSGWHRP